MCRSPPSPVRACLPSLSSRKIAGERRSSTRTRVASSPALVATVGSKTIRSGRGSSSVHLAWSRQGFAGEEGETGKEVPLPELHPLHDRCEVNRSMHLCLLRSLARWIRGGARFNDSAAILWRRRARAATPSSRAARRWARTGGGTSSASGFVAVAPVSGVGGPWRWRTTSNPTPDRRLLIFSHVWSALSLPCVECLRGETSKAFLPPLCLRLSPCGQ